MFVGGGVVFLGLHTGEEPCQIIVFFNLARDFNIHTLLFRLVKRVKKENRKQEKKKKKKKK